MNSPDAPAQSVLEPPATMAAPRVFLRSVHLTPIHGEGRSEAAPRIVISNECGYKAGLERRLGPPKIRLSPIGGTPVDVKEPGGLTEDPLWEAYQRERAPVYRFPIGGHCVMRGVFWRRDLRGLSVKGWWVSEKLDGVRAIWTGRQLLTRTGHVIVAPLEWLAGLPSDMALDGELYLGRKLFDRISGICRCQVPDPCAWQEVRYMVYDLPDTIRPYQEVYQILHRAYLRGVAEGVLHWKPVQQTVIPDEHWLLQYHRQLMQEGAEGTMIRDPRGRYVLGRCTWLLKYKARPGPDGVLCETLDDQAVVTGYELSDKEQYRHKATGQLGLKSLEVRWCDREQFFLNPTFSVGGALTREQRQNYAALFPIGTIIDVVYTELYEETQKPRFPRFGRVVSAPH